MTEQRKVDVTWEQIQQYADSVAKIIMASIVRGDITPIQRKYRAYGIPRGGIHAVHAVKASMRVLAPLVDFQIVEDPQHATMFIDDIIDSGATLSKWNEEFLRIPFYALIDKQQRKTLDTWYTFPWERAVKEDGPEDNITRLLQFIGEDVKRNGLLETPKRVVASYKELFAGYHINPKDLIKTFESDCDEMVLVRDIEFCSMCEHHMLPFIGKGHIAYIPSGRVIGVSKLARILECYSRRLQNQERITQQVTKALDTYLSPKGSACVLEAKHLCMACRGVGKQHSVMVTSSLTGAFRDKPEARAEFMQLIKG